MTIALIGLKYIAISLVITLAIGLGLTLSQWPGEARSSGGLDFTDTVAKTAENPAPLIAENGQSYRHYPGTGALVVLVHGSGWHGLQFDALARKLAEGGLEVVVPDLRGHGASPQRRGDVDYIGQLEDDLAALIASHKKPGQNVILAGHSSGGGLVVRFAGGTHGDVIDGAVLLAPFLKYNAPSTRPNSGGWAHVLTRRIIGLSILNTFKITALNHLEVIQFTFPDSVRNGPLGATVTDAYSYRLNTSFAPRSAYLKDIASLPPFLLMAGTSDEAFVAEAYQPLMTPVTDQGRYVLVDGIGHLGIVDAPKTVSEILTFVRSLRADQ